MIVTEDKKILRYQLFGDFFVTEYMFCITVNYYHKTSRNK